MAIEISDSLRTFARERLASVEQIEIVLLLLRDPERSWTAPEVAAELGTAPESAAMRLFLLASSGLIAFEPAGVPRYRYAPADAATDSELRALARVYPEQKSAIAALVGAPADPLRSFSDAFRWKG